MTNKSQWEMMAFRRSATTETTLAYMGALLSFLVSARETGGGLSILVAHIRPGSEPPPHLHDREHEVFYLLEGEMEFFVEGVAEPLAARSGDIVFLPATKAHAYSIVSPEAKTLTIVHAVDGHSVGIEPFLRGMALGPATSMELPEVAERYAPKGIEAMEQAAKLASDSNAAFLSPEEAARRLPSYRRSNAAA